MSKCHDLTGLRFGRLLVEGRADNYVSPKGNVRSQWYCVCDCGVRLIVAQDSLKKGKSQSCGCLKKELVGERNRERCTTHGKTGTRLFNVWKGMKQRCFDKSHLHYAEYGGRGITICEEWLTFETFLRWAIENGYDELASRGECTIDRNDNDGNYEPSNCRWATMKEQRQNQRERRVIRHENP